MEKKKVVVFKENYKYYFTSVDNYFREILDRNKLVEMTGFNDLEDCRNFLEEQYDYEVMVAK